MLRTNTVALAVCLWLTACSGAVVQPDGGSETPTDSGTVAADAGPQVPVAVCERCAEDSDCAEEHRCVGLDGGGHLCLPSCSSSTTCPDRFECVDEVCTPTNGRCCLDPDGDTFGAGAGCRGDDCDETDVAVNFGALEQCDSLDNDCDGMIDEDAAGSGETCATSLSGACASGVTACMNGALQCRPTLGALPEACDGLDNDCDSFVDEDSAGLALTRACYGGPMGTLGVGLCAAGTETCAGGQYRSCVGEIRPSPETCDGLDNDCDGVVDQGDPGGGGTCSTGAPGLCATGTMHCDGGVLSCLPSMTPGTQPELCDQLDNDCDGVIDDGFAGLGEPCTAGLGTCARGGVVTCDPTDSTRTACSATPGTANATETCDYLDDDCDGEVDEGFRSDAGVYADRANCGACGRDCELDWPAGAAASHVIPTCAVSGATASCGFVCEAGYRDLDGLRENGCEFRDEPDTVFVSSSRGVNSSSCGTVLVPCASLEFGIFRAISTGRARVRASAGLYRENVSLASGISVLGGHSDLTWARDPAVFRTTLRGADASTGGAGAGANDRVVVSAVNVTTPTELSGFAIEAINARGGGNSIAIYVRDSTQALSITDNEIISGAGGNGASGNAGTHGAPGAAGAAGAGSIRQACGSPSRPGPAGGATSCGVTSANGGAGGASTNPTTSSTVPTRQPTATSGVGSRGGPGGLGGFNMEGASGPNCSVFGALEGGAGTNGTIAPDGSGGAGATDSDGTLTTNHWRGISGNAGSDGSPGGGGGGGAAPGGVEEIVGTLQCIFPPTGGSGGAGGCGGGRGLGGSAGGGSFGVMIVHTATVSASAMPRVTNNRLRRGDGGRGGDGGAGGGGGAGGLGGAGGPSPTAPFANTYDFCIRPGARGGDGARGGHAGGGGGGAGGVSFDIWVSRPGAAAPDYTQNMFELPAATNTGGLGGAGGGSLNTLVGVGGNGSPGDFGTVRVGT